MALSQLIYELYSHQWIQADQNKTIGVNGNKIKRLFGNCDCGTIGPSIDSVSSFLSEIVGKYGLLFGYVEPPDGFLRCDDERSYLAKNTSGIDANGSLSTSRLSFIDSRLVPLTPSIDLWLLIPKCIRIPSNGFFDLPSCLV
ncbi:uncharacterized protein MELLADRAFT_107544 [Melampsora larici-populina 98AG31]|uniref:Uncharacterized protein n=1 Tax=Melampsora larici-populina (strain 98AG31 / pathotype 3-4-7) TaxID=747676 RepID=F4RQM0_MELLP|nr:uncharacterized protein MELLADRAFT_107544 [Melampsora larici-populina 98AG31]EGG05490.1 hypothetical protein MELLADRAFT_107544 [Melampsora larici-populina 98AG31]